MGRLSVAHAHTEDDEQTTVVNAIAMDTEQDNTNYGSRGLQLDKLQKVKLRVSKQNEKPLKEVYDWVKDRNHDKEKWSIEGVMEILGSVNKSLSHGREFVL